MSPNNDRAVRLWSDNQGDSFSDERESPHDEEWIARTVADDEARENILRGIDEERARYLARGERDAAELVALRAERDEAARERDLWRERAERAEGGK